MHRERCSPRARQQELAAPCGPVDGARDGSEQGQDTYTAGRGLWSTGPSCRQSRAVTVTAGDSRQGCPDCRLVGYGLWTASPWLVWQVQGQTGNSSPQHAGQTPGRQEAGCGHVGDVAQPRDQGQEPKLGGISRGKEGQESAESSQSLFEGWTAALSKLAPSRSARPWGETRGRQSSDSYSTTGTTQQIQISSFGAIIVWNPEMLPEIPLSFKM